jgi:hypothetical protein
MEFSFQILPYCIMLDALTWWEFTKGFNCQFGAQA